MLFLPPPHFAGGGNKNAIRYRLHHKSGLLKLIYDINGLIRNPYRLLQLKKLSYKYKFNLILPNDLNYWNGWLAGFIDSDGTITINKTNWQLSISVSQKTTELLNPLVLLYGGYIYIDRSSQSFKWYITKKEDILKLIEYLKIYPLRSIKFKRLILIPKFYELKNLNAYKAPINSCLAKSWLTFLKKWE